MVCNKFLIIVSYLAVFMGLKSNHNLFSPEVKSHLLSISSSTEERKREIWEDVVRKLNTKYPQAITEHRLTFSSFILQRYVIGAFLVVLILGTAFSVDALPVPPGDTIPYVTKAQLQNAKFAVLKFFSNDAAGKYRNKLVTRRLDDFSKVVTNPEGANLESVAVVSKSLADQLGEYYGGKFSPNQTEFALDTVKKVHLALDNARKVFAGKNQGTEENTQISDSLNEVSRIGNEVLKQQVELKLAESRKAHQSSKGFIEAEEAYQRGDFVAALEKLEQSQNPGVVQGDQVAALAQPQSQLGDVLAETDGEVPTTSRIVVTGIKSSSSKKDPHAPSQQIEYAVGLEL